MSYLTTHFPNYRIKCEYDQETNMFPRKLDGTLEDIDCYISCYHNVQIFYYGKGILEAYIPSLIRGHNYIKAIKEEFKTNENIIFDITESDSEVLFKFNSKNMDRLEKYLKPKTAGAKISPFSPKNLPKINYKIPDEDFVEYKKIVDNLPREHVLNVAHSTNNFIKSLATKNKTYDDIKADMAKKCIKGKEYIHSIGLWDNYIKYLRIVLFEKGSG